MRSIEYYCGKEFFESNICIPKGTNRHPYADVLHEWLEDINKILQWGVDGKYYHSDLNNKIAMGIPLRIKPSEPNYEYEFAININGVLLKSEYMTQQEWSASALKYVSRRNEETKRIRK